VTTTEENKAIVRRWFEEVINQGNVEAVDVICAQCAPSFVVIKGVDEDASGGLEGVKSLVQTFHKAFPDLKFKIEDQIAEDNKVVSRLSIEGTHSGEFMGIPPTNKQFSIKGVSIWLVGEGKLVEEWVSWDTMGMMQQLGLMGGSP
jgi:steroid delta-isomerase-like uncharacterized protein